MEVGLSPLVGPRGLIRVYTPYLGQPGLRVMNFIAVEPVVNGVRGLSELETSHLDGKQGLRMWAADSVDLGNLPVASDGAARGVVGSDSRGQTLSVYFCVERYANGAHCVVKILFHADRPHEVCLSTLAAGDSEPMDACVLTATMGNFARLRHLHLRDRTVEASALFRGALINSMGFFDWHSWPMGELSERDGEVWVSATGDRDVVTPGDVPKGWRYVGRPAVQSWSTEACPGLRARVNGRETFWASHASIPGGAAVENFELYSPFEEGQTFRFGVEEEGAR